MRVGAPRPPCCILHLEDSSIDAELVAEFLGRAHIEARIERVADRAGYEAALARGGHDLILADYSVPGFRDFEALTLAQRLCPGLPFLFVSGAPGEEIAIESLKRGAVDFVVKQRLGRLPVAVQRALDEAAATAALHAAERRHAEILESISDAFYAVNREGRLVFANRRAEQLWGRPPPLGQPLFEDFPPGLPGTAAMHREALATREVMRFEVESLALATWLEVSIYPSETGISVFCHDIGDRKQAEAALRRLNETLESRIVDAVAARIQVEEALRQSQKLEALGQLAGGIAHDFNNVLQAVAGGARLIERKAEDAVMVRRLARMLLETSERGASVARRLLGFARRDELRAETVDAAEMLAGLYEVLAHTLGAGIQVQVEAMGMLPAILADKGQLETVLVNLATNARDAMQEKGGSLVLGAAAETVAGGAEGTTGPGPGTYVRLTVRDTGAGMDAATLARAAEPFFTTKPRGKGTGLGLAMARGFAEQSGGAFRIESEPGRGTQVTLWLPQAGRGSGQAGEAAPVPAATAVTGPPTMTERITVLIVDDEPLVRDFISAEFIARGHQVEVAESGEAALRRLGGEGPADLLVTDLAMPGMDGLTLIREARKKRPGLPALLLTGHAGDGAADLLDGALRGGPFRLLRKPMPPDHLADAAMLLLASTRVAA